MAPVLLDTYNIIEFLHFVSSLLYIAYSYCTNNLQQIQVQKVKVKVKVWPNCELFCQRESQSERQNYLFANFNIILTILFLRCQKLCIFGTYYGKIPLCRFTKHKFKVLFKAISKNNKARKLYDYLKYSKYGYIAAI